MLAFAFLQLYIAVAVIFVELFTKHVLVLLVWYRHGIRSPTSPKSSFGDAAEPEITPVKIGQSDTNNNHQLLCFTAIIPSVLKWLAFSELASPVTQLCQCTEAVLYLLLILLIELLHWCHETAADNGKISSLQVLPSFSGFRLSSKPKNFGWPPSRDCGVINWTYGVHQPLVMAK